MRQSRLTSEKACRRRIQDHALDQATDVDDDLWFDYVREDFPKSLVIISAHSDASGEDAPRYWISVHGWSPEVRACSIVLFEEPADTDGESEGVDSDGWEHPCFTSIVVSQRWDEFALLPLTEADLIESRTGGCGREIQRYRLMSGKRSRPWGGLKVHHALEDDEWDEDEWGDDELDLSGVWRRPRGEYLPGPHRLELCTMEEARYSHEKADLDWDDKVSFVTGIRGNAYHPEAYKDEALRGEVWFELVPEPNNPHDPHALAVDLHGVRAGYVGANMAAYYQWLVRAANGTGMRCFTPGFIEAPTSTWLVLPTLKVAEDVLDAPNLEQRLRAIYDGLPRELQELIEGDGFHPSDSTAAELWKYRSLETSLFPTRPDPESYSWGWSRVFNTVRLERNERQAEARRQKREQEQADKERRRQAREESAAQRDSRIRELTHHGHSKAAIGRILGVSHDTIRKVVGNSNGMPQGGSNPWSETMQDERIERCFRAIELQQEGATRQQIAQLLGVGPDTVKELLADGRSYLDPEANPTRLALARRAKTEGWTNAKAKAAGVSGLRAAKDARILAKLGLG